MPHRVRTFPPLMLMGFACAVFAQQKATPGGGGAAAAAAQGAVATIKTNARLVVVDVVATDKSGRPVHGLKAGDFTVLENGSAQTLKGFEEHTALTAVDAARFAPMPTLPPGIFTNYTPAPANGAVNLVLLDALNTPLSDQAYVRQQLLAYLKAVPPGTRVAIFGLTNRLTILQGFTSDPETLRRVLERGRGKGSPLLDDQVGGGGIQNSMADDMEDMGVDAGVVANVQQFEAQVQSFQTQLRIKYTLDGFNQLARYLASIPGRKNLVWFSGSFPISILPDATGTLMNPFAVAADYQDEFRETVDLLGRAQVAVYPVDARGLTNSPLTDVTTTRNYAGARGAQRMVQDQNKYFTDTANEHGTMNAMADATGGHAFFNTNDLTRAVASAIEQGSNFYTLAYTPADSATDGKLHKIKVAASRTGLTLTYRQGYYADAPEKTETKPGTATAGVADQAVSSDNGLSARESLRLAMTRGAPTPSEILIKTGVVPFTPAASPEETVAAGNVVSPKTHGPWRRYSVNYQIDPVDIVFLREPDGKVHADFDLMIFVYSPDGTVLNRAVSGAHIADTMDGIRQLAKQGIFCHMEVSAPAKGESFLRIAVHDLHRDRYGAVEVATSQVKAVVPQQPVAAQAKPDGAK